MAWDFFPLSVDDDIQNYLVWNELLIALHERERAIGLTDNQHFAPELASMDKMPGVVELVNGLDTIEGTSTEFTTELSVGDIFYCEVFIGGPGGGEFLFPFIVASITDDENLTIETTYTGPAQASEPSYRIKCGDWFRASNIASFQDRIEARAVDFVDHTDLSGDWSGVSNSSDIAPAWVFGGAGLNDITSPAHADIGKESGTWSRSFKKPGESGSGSQGRDIALSVVSDMRLSDDQVDDSGRDIALSVVSDLRFDQSFSVEVETFGQAEDCDMAGYDWINEMFRIIDFMRWSRSTGQYKEDTGAFTVVTDAVPSIHPTYDAAFAALVTSHPGAFDTVDDDALPRRTSTVNRDSGGSFGAAGNNARNKLKSNETYIDDIKKQNDFYGYAARTGIDEFDDDSLGLIQDKWNLLFTILDNFDTTVISEFFGDDGTLQNKPTDPGLGLSDSVTRGWGMASQGSVDVIVVDRWDVLLGFVKAT